MILGCPNCGARFRVGSGAIGAAGRRVRCSQCHHQWNATARDLQPEPAAAAPAAPAKPKVAVKRNPLKPKKAAPPPPPPPPPKPVAETPPPPPPEEPPPALEPELASAPLSDAAADAELQAASEPPPIPEAPEEPPPSRGRKPAPKKRSVLGRIAAVIGWLLFVLALGGLAGAAYKSELVMEEFPETKPVFAALGFDLPLPGEGLQIPKNDVTSRRVEIEGVPALLIEGKVMNITDSRRITVPLLRGSLRDSNDREVAAWTFKTASMKLAPGESAPFRTEVRRPPAQATGLSITFVPAE